MNDPSTKQIIYPLTLTLKSSSKFSFSNEAGGKWPFVGGDNEATP